MMEEKRYLNNIIYIRGIMILFVVIGHALSICVDNYAGHQVIESTIGSGIRTIIYSFHMPVYMAISGYLFYFEVEKSLTKKLFNGYGRFIWKKTKRLIIPFIFVMYLWRKPLLFLTDISAWDGLSPLQILTSYLSISTTGALWFLYVLFIIFIGQRLLVKVIWTSDKRVCIWLWIFSLTSIMAYRFSGPIHHVMLYTVYFFLGTLIHKYQNRSKKQIFSILEVTAVIGTVVLLFIKPTGVVDSLIRFVTAVSDIYLILNLSDKYTVNLCKPISLISDLSMGIYLFHEPLILAVGSQLPNQVRGGILILAFVLIGLLFSMGITLLLRTVGLKFVMGE